MFSKHLDRLTSALNSKPNGSDHTVLQIFIICIGTGAVPALIYIINLISGYYDPLLLAPYVVSAIMIFTMPSSNMTSPLSTLQAYILCSLVGFAFVYLFEYSQWAIVGAFGISFFLMAILDCLHLPAIMMPILIVSLPLRDYHLAINPIGIDVLLLVTITFLFNKVLDKTKRINKYT